MTESTKKVKQWIVKVDKKNCSMRGGVIEVPHHLTYIGNDYQGHFADEIWIDGRMYVRSVNNLYYGGACNYLLAVP